MAIELTDLVMKMAQSQVETERNAKLAVEGASEVRKALTKLVSQVQSILDEGSDEGGYEVAFVVDLALKAEEADRRYESLANTAAGSQNQLTLLKELVEQAKG